MKPAVLRGVGTAAAPTAGLVVHHRNGGAVLGVEGDFLVFDTAVPAVRGVLGYPAVVALEGVPLDAHIHTEGRHHHFCNGGVHVQGVDGQIRFQPNGVVRVVQGGAEGPGRVTVIGSLPLLLLLIPNGIVVELPQGDLHGAAIKGFPLKISYQGHMVVRGEATISYTDFEMINDLIEDDDEKYANPRNLASGTLSLDDPQKVKERCVYFHAFTLVYREEGIRSFGEQMDYLDKEGFLTVERERCNEDSLDEVIARWTHKVESGQMDIPVDGLVICYDDTVYAATGSVTGHHATRAGFAFKWADVSATSKLRYVEWSCAASTISPVAVFEPVQLEGTTVSRASLCNISEMERLGIGEECTLEIIKANKIIPKCIAVKEAKGSFHIPETCPVCGARTQIHISNSGTKTLHCTNPDCTARQGKKYTRFVSKSGMDIDGLSIQTMLRFMNEGFVHEFADIYHLGQHAETIRNMEGFGDKSSENLLNAVEKFFIRSRNPPKIIGSVSFGGFLERMKNGQGFEDVDGIGPEKSGSVMEWYQIAKNKEALEHLLQEVRIIQGEAVSAEGGTCAGLIFVITGDVHRFKNRDAFKSYVEQQGGKVTGSVSAKTNFLINNDSESSSGKNRKAKELGIPILTEDEFIERF